MNNSLLSEHELQMIIHAAELVNSNVSVDEVLRRIVSVAKEIAGADRGTLYLIDYDRNELYSKILLGEEIQEIRLKIGEGLAGHVAKTGETINIKDVAAHSQFNSGVDNSSGYKTKNMLCFPLKNTEGTLIGVLQLLNNKNGEFTNHDEELLNAISIHSAIAIQNAELIENLNLAVKRLNVLNEIAVSSISKANVYEIISAVVEKTKSTLKAEHVSIKLLPWQTSRANYDAGIHEIESQFVSPNLIRSIIEHVSENNQSVLIENLKNDIKYSQTVSADCKIQTLLCSPMKFNEQIIGVLLVINRMSGQKFNQNDLEFLSIISSQTAQLLTNIQLQQDALEKIQLEHELELAQKIQRGLLPQNYPKDKCIDIAAYFNATVKVGGDYYDFFNFPNDKTGIVIADVAGHGPSAAMLMSMMKGMLHSLAHQYSSPDQMLGDLNLLISKAAPDSSFITAQFLEFDTANRLLKVSSAGHNPVLHYSHESNSVEEINVFARALNAWPDSKYSVEKLPIEVNDIFVIFTDGVTETTNYSNELFGTNNLGEVIKKNKDFSSEEITNRIHSELLSFSEGKPFEDDIAIVTIKIIN